MMNDYDTKTMQFLIKETLDLILTRDKLDIRNNEHIDLFFDSIDQMKSFLDINFVIGALKGLHVVIDLTHRNGLLYIKNVFNYLEFERRKETSFSSNLRGEKIDNKFLINYVNSGKDLLKLDKVRTIKKVKFYDKFYNIYYVLSLLDVIKSLKESMKLMLEIESSNSNLKVKDLPLFKEVRSYYIILTKLLNNYIIQEIVLKHKDKIKNTVYKKALMNQMNLNYRALSKEYRYFFNWNKNFYYEDKFISHKNLTNDRLFEYYTIKYLSSIFDKDIFTIIQNPIYKNSLLPVYKITNDKNIINIYYQNSTPLRMPKMFINHDISFNSLGTEMILIPDIIIEIENKSTGYKNFIILDSKYRTGFNASDDRYKMLGYLYNLGKTDIPLILMYYNFKDGKIREPKIYKHRNFDKGYLASLIIGDVESNLQSLDVLSRIINSIL